MKKLHIIFVLIAAAAIHAAAQTCPDLRVIGPERIAVTGEPMTFTVDLGNYKSNTPLRYEWSATRGTIHSGQGSPAVKVMTTPADNGSNLSGVVKVYGLPRGCPNEASALTGVGRDDLPMPVERYVAIPKDVLRERIAIFFDRIKNTPGAVGIVDVSFNRKETSAERSKYLNSLYKAFAASGNDLSLISFTWTEDDHMRETAFWVLPKGADMSPQEIDPARLIPGNEFMQRIKTMLK